MKKEELLMIEKELFKKPKKNNKNSKQKNRKLNSRINKRQNQLSMLIQICKKLKKMIMRKPLENYM